MLPVSFSERQNVHEVQSQSLSLWHCDEPELVRFPLHLRTTAIAFQVYTFSDGVTALSLSLPLSALLRREGHCLQSRFSPDKHLISDPTSRSLENCRSSGAAHSACLALQSPCMALHGDFRRNTRLSKKKVCDVFYRGRLVVEMSIIYWLIACHISLP